MKLEKILKITIPIIVTGTIIYKIAINYNERRGEKYLDRLREKGL